MAGHHFICLTSKGIIHAKNIVICFNSTNDEVSIFMKLITNKADWQTMIQNYVVMLTTHDFYKCDL